jgi:predicted Rossmann fold nucleotide-binding protein DprA/Smf involved in DNA uptake
MSPLPPNTVYIGDLTILQSPKLALFCSTRCPGRLILQTYDLVRALRDAGRVVIGGFHTPMEREALALLLRGTQPVIICPARAIDGMRLPPAWNPPLAEHRLLLLSPFPPHQRRVTRELAAARNTFVAALADAVLIPHAAPDSTTERLGRDVLTSGKPVFTLDDDANGHLIAAGAVPITPRDIDRIAGTADVAIGADGVGADG